MNETRPGTFLQITALGTIAGMRSMSAPMLVTRHLAGNGKSQPLVWDGMPVLAGLFTLAALGEMVIDKLPFVPDRTERGSVMGRVMSGMFAGALLAAAGERPRVMGAVVGGVAALLSTYGFYHLRRWAVRRSQLPDPLVAAVEDALAQGLGHIVLT
jgi:uncharacterized membrane protein